MESKAHIAVVDDDPSIREILRTLLEGEYYRVSEARDARQLDQVLEIGTVDLVTLDIGLGSDDGLAIARELRQRSDVGIIMVTAKTDPIDTVIGLEFGADDYIAKPFNLREVLARIKSVLRRRAATAASPGTPAQDKVMFGGWTLDRVNRELVAPSGCAITLSTTEFDLLNAFVLHPSRALSRQRLIDLTKGAGWSANDRVVDNQIGRLKRKMANMDDGKPVIRSVRGVGYILAAKVTPVPTGREGLRSELAENGR